MDAYYLTEPLEGTDFLPKSTQTMARNLQWWFKVSVHTILVLAGQSVATLLGRFYYDQGGKSKWLQTLTFSAGFPILYLPLLITTHSSSSSTSHPLPLVKITVIYIILGLMATGDSLMYSYGLLYLSVSTYSLVSATQLGFNAVFSYFINSERFTHLTFNSVIILTFSAAIIAFQPASDDSSETSGGKYMLGFILTLAASATYSLNLSLMELTFDKIIKCRALSAVLNMQIYTALVSTVGAIIGLFASGEWRELKKDMEGFNQGRLSYVMTLVWTSICWQVTNVGLVGLIFEVSSLFSNVISSLAVPIAPVFAVILFHDTINGIKVMSLLMALWGFVSYFYQHYLDYKKEKTALLGVRESMQLNGRV
ncbi:LOW QUALITY PROTEIN: probable purine permease 11 [Dioscorea cayenensis subsp. rotundata]|uniref:Probable purine permease n=1 Tax=Dioscorea cayennensis subsp. rotundata TaxID=55577 RepID=A0AB40CQZ2_DIOCR|nr:LOW QUALITY PROTEIN: probable purine permease 11 [Dioscorea cayenensis subsp. rotundata]